MEVHAHTHTARKKWTHYFWEFLMLFLAVFCGFLAENQREHMVEHRREKQFIRSLVSDVAADTARLNEIITYRNLRQARLDSLTFLLNSDSAERHTNDIYFFGIFIPRIAIFQFTSNEGTMHQLKNAGGLRLIRKLFVADSIINYDASVRTLQRTADQESDILLIYRESGPKIYNGLEMEKLTDADNFPIRVTHNPPLVPGYKEHLIEFNYRLTSVKSVNKGYRREARKLLIQAINLLNTLKKEYRLE